MDERKNFEYDAEKKEQKYNYGQAKLYTSLKQNIQRQYRRAKEENHEKKCQELKQLDRALTQYCLRKKMNKRPKRVTVDLVVRPRLEIY